MFKFLKIASLVLFFALPAAAQTPPPIRVSCGGGSYTDSKGQVWQADHGFVGGSVSTIPATIKGTADQALFQHARLNTGSSGMKYSFPVTPGWYHVNLYFAETLSSDMAVGRSIFNVKLQEAATFTNVDVFAEAGADAELIKGSDTQVVDGVLTIEFDNSASDPARVNAIEILPGHSGPALALSFKYPDGTPVAGKLNYTISSTLLSYSGSEALTNGQVSAALIANPSTLGISLQFVLNATLIDTAGHELWQIKLGMNPSQINLAAVQDSTLNVVVQKVESATGGGGGI